MDILFSSFANLFSMMGSVFSLVFDIWFILLPPFLLYIFKLLWIGYAQGKYASGLKWVLLEITPPRDIEKSPELMELIYSGFAGVIKSPNTPEEWIKGEFPVSFSLEIVSLEGMTHMYVRTQAGFRNLVEAHFYAQYPNVEITEVPDYVQTVPATVPNNEWDLWGADFELVKDDLYPIKTYKHFEESVTGKMIDPLAGIFETMGKIGPGQNMWLQYIITPVKESWYKTGQATVDEFLGKVEEEKPSVIWEFLGGVKDFMVSILKGIMGQEMTSEGEAKSEKKDEAPVEFRLTPGEKDVLKALQENLGKQMFSTKMRYLYIGRQEVFSKTTGVSAFIGGLKQFANQNMNGFKPNDASKTYANYIFTQSRLRYRQRRIFTRYVHRDAAPEGSSFLLSSEELATVFHVPDMAVVAPSLARVAAKRSSGPPNLPIQEI